MYKLIISGGNPLRGEIRVQGSKNAVLPILAATVLTDEKCLIHNCPDISDAHASLDILRSLGCWAEFSKGSGTVCADKIDKAYICPEIFGSDHCPVLLKLD